MSSPFFFQEMWRMDWGLGNPNKTAGLIAILMVAVWALAFVRRWGFWLALSLFIGLGVCLIHTFSRGGLIAAFVGLPVLLWKLPRPWPMRQSIAIIASIWVMVGVSIFLDAYVRYGQGVISEDRSITNRIALWKSAPAMMVDAPEGWGIGKSGISYVRWYQSLDRNEPYRTLVNSHLTWLVEFGWLGRFLYLTLWALVLVLCWPRKNARVLVICLGIWVSFGISAMFSSVAESIWLWIVPGLALAFAIGFRVQRGVWPKGRVFLIPPAFAVAVCVTIFAIGSRTPSLVKRHDSMTVFGKGDPEYLLFADAATLGENYHRILRQWAARVKLPTIGIMGSTAIMPNLNHTKVILAGVKGSEQTESLRPIFQNAAQVILINPKLFPEEIGLTEAKAPRIEVILGEFAQVAASSNWNQIASVRELRGIGDFIPDWPINILGIQEDTK